MEAKTKVGKKKRVKEFNPHTGLKSLTCKGASVGEIPYTPTPPHIIGKSSFVRRDGLMVFLDSDRVLNHIRLSESDPRKVILAVALRRAQQTACSYAKKHFPELYEEISKSVGIQKNLLITQGG